MKKIVSKEGVSYFYEMSDDDVECIAYETNKYITGSEVASRLDISRSAVSQSLKRSIKRVYFGVKKRYKLTSDIEVMCIMSTMFNIRTESEYKKFFNFFPSNIKDNVNAEAKRTGYCRNN